MRTPERRLEIVSFRAKLIAKPVNPSPATSADISTPNVPSAVTIPKILSDYSLYYFRNDKENEENYYSAAYCRCQKSRFLK